MAQIDIGSLITVAVGIITIVTFIYTNAKNQEHTNSRIDVVETKLEHNNSELSELKDEVHKNNQLKDRMYKIEGRADVLEQQIKVEQHRMTDVENALKEKR